jgi:hypothetical protein
LPPVLRDPTENGKLPLRLAANLGELAEVDPVPGPDVEAKGGLVSSRSSQPWHGEGATALHHGGGCSIQAGRGAADWVESLPDAPFSFVTDGVEAAVSRAQQIAGDRTVFVSASTIARQCLELGLLDEVMIDLVPVVMGGDHERISGGRRAALAGHSRGLTLHAALVEGEPS